jgi:hypothetical protein
MKAINKLTREKGLKYVSEAGKKVSLLTYIKFFFCLGSQYERKKEKKGEKIRENIQSLLNLEFALS